MASTSEAAPDACMEKWSILITAISKVVPNVAVVSIDRMPGDSVTQHWEAFKKVFDEACSNPGPLKVVITHGGGNLCYKFRGETEIEEAEVIGVPSYDTLIYISNAGRVAMTGTGAQALSEAMRPWMSGHQRARGRVPG